MSDERSLARRLLLVAGLAAGLTGAAAQAQPAPAPFQAGAPLGMVNQAGEAKVMSPNVKVFGSFRFAESCVYDPARNLILAINSGVTEAQQPNDGFVSLINPDGSVHTAKWIGVNRNGLTLNQPLGSAIHKGMLYIVDIDTLRMFDLATGAPRGAVQVPGAEVLNGVAVAADGAVYVSNTRALARIYKITPAGQVSVFVDGPPLMAPNGLAIDPAGRLVVVNVDDKAVITFDEAGKAVLTEQAAEGGNDGIVIMPDGVKYVSSVRYGSISKIAPGKPAEVIATGIPSAASMCFESRRKQLVVPLNDNNALAFVPLG